jgi:peptidoglycan/xylan/chitin deacetylase (PgdA/CDA1 family)
MALTTTSLGLQKPDGTEMVKDGDNVIAANAQKADDLIVADRGRLTTLETAGYVPAWKTATAYTAGQRVISPGGDVVAAIANHTSTTYVPANWTASTQDGRIGAVEAKNAAQDAALTDRPPFWKATTAYTSGQRVISPDGDIVSAKTGFTSGASYDASNWNASTQDGRITQNTVWMGVINSGGDLNNAVGKAQRISLYEIGAYGAGIANMPPNPYHGQVEVVADGDGKNIIQRVTYDPVSSPQYDGVYYRTGADLSGTGTFTFSAWKQMTSADVLAAYTWRGVINTGGDLNAATGQKQRISLYEIGDYGSGIANMPPNPYRGQMKVMSDYDGRNIVQEVTYDAAASPQYDGLYYRSGVDATGGGTFTYGAWMRKLSDKDIPRAEKNTGIVSSIQSGHGWTAGPTTYATFAMDDTTDMAVGDRCITISTDGTGHNSYIQKTGLNLDLTGLGLVFWLKGTNLQSIGSVSVTIANADTLTPAWFASLPLAAGNKSPLSENEWFPVYLSMGNAGINSGTPNWTKVTALRLNFTDKAGMAAPTLKLGGVGTFQDRTVRYPAGVISLTFDDTYDVQATVAAPKLAAYGFPGTSYLIYDRIGGAGYLSTAQLNMLKEVYGWEIGAHATNSAAHIDWTTQTSAWVDSELQAQKAWQSANGFPTETFAYPIGPFNSTTARIVEKYYASARSTYGWTNSAAHPHKYRMSCYVINAAVTLATAKTWVDRAAAQGGWPVFLFHNLVASGATGNDWLISDFNSLIDYVATSGLPVATVGDVIRQRP